MAKQLNITSQSKPAWCAPGGAVAMIPPGASDDVIKKVLTNVLENRLEHAMQASHPDTRKYAESLAEHIMLYAQRCGEQHKINAIPLISLNAPSEEECAALNACVDQLITIAEPKKKTAYEMMKIPIGRVAYFLGFKDFGDAGEGNAVVGVRG